MLEASTSGGFIIFYRSKAKMWEKGLPQIKWRNHRSDICRSPIPGFQFGTFRARS